MHAPFAFSIGHAPSSRSGIAFRPDARNAFAASIASPRVSIGVRPVSLNWQHSVRRTHARSTGRASSSR